MTDRKHALLSASGASRWLVCTPSARLEEETEEQESVYADEGTVAHELGEILIKEVAYGIDMSAMLDRMKKTEAWQEYYNEEMYGYCLDYAKYVVDQVRNASEGAILIQEQRLNLAMYIPEGFGTVDNCIVAEPKLKVVDLKYGKGVPVDAYENKQLMIYGLGALLEYDLMYDIREVELTIYQPRIDNISSYTITADNLRKWAIEVLRPIAIQAYEGLGEFIPGEHCRFCRVKSTCKANALMNMQLAAREFDPPLMTDEQVVKILQHADRIKKWLTGLQDFALNRAKEGYKWPGMKLVEGRSNRKYTDEVAILQGLISAGYEGDKLVNKKILGITEMSRKVSKLHFQQYVDPYLEKPQGKATLVTDEDARPELNKDTEAEAEFEIIPD